MKKVSLFFVLSNISFIGTALAAGSRGENIAGVLTGNAIAFCLLFLLIWHTLIKNNKKSIVGWALVIIIFIFGVLPVWTRLLA